MKSKEYPANLKLKTVDELKSELAKQRKKMATLRIEHSTGKLKDYKALLKTRRKIAQVLTIMKEMRSLGQIKH